MRAEDIAPRTWLLAALAGWALLAWILALAGLGGRVAPLAEDPSLVQPLPQLRPSAPERLGPYAQYGELASRPLFSEDRRPKPFSLRSEGEGEQTNAFDYVLTSVLLTPGLKLAILQPAGDAQGGAPIRVKLGESAEQAAAWRLVSLEPRQAVFEGPDGQRSIELRAYDGTGGEPATPASQPVARSGSPAIRPVVRSDASAESADAAAAAAAAAAVAPPTSAEPPQAVTDATASVAEPAVATPDAQIEAIRKRIQARREQLRREAQQPPPPPNTD